MISKSVTLLVALGIVALPALAMAEENKADLQVPAYSLLADVTGRYVNVSGSHTKFLEDYNLQNGADTALKWDKELSDDRSVGIDTLGQWGEEQGYFLGHYQRLGHYSLLLDTNAIETFYNARTGRPPVIGDGIFPETNDGRFFSGKNGFVSGPGGFLFGQQNPSINRILTGGSYDFQPRSGFHDIYVDLHYQKVWGRETTLKGSPISGGPGGDVDGSGPGTGSVDFDFPGQKRVDNDTYRGLLGGRSGVGGINWQTDATYEHSDISSNQREPNFGGATDGSDTEIQKYIEHNRVDVVNYDLVGSRFLKTDLYVYGGYLFSFQRNQPLPSQQVQVSGTDPTSVIDTRGSNSGGEVHRLANGLRLGGLYTPHPAFHLTFNTGARGFTQSGDITETRDEGTFFELGNTGQVRNQVDRSWVDTTSDLRGDWTWIPQTLVTGRARYTYRRETTDSNRAFDFSQARGPAVANYADRFNTFDLGPSARYSAGHGRSVEVGYQFLSENVNVTVDQLSNDYIQNSYWRERHYAYLKGLARITKTLHGELRFQYVRENRDLKAPLVDPDLVPSAKGGKTFWEGYSVVPNLTYQPDPHWSLYSSVAVAEGRQRVQNLGTVPANFASQFTPFQYDALTETFAIGAGYTPSGVWSFSASFNLVNSDKSVDNQIYRVEGTARYQINKTWSVRAGYRYLRFDESQTNVDQYVANLPFLGISGRF
jgi:hypothetical protein